jgi:hypothetical protein
MKPEEILGIVVRTIGFWEVAGGLEAIGAIGGGLGVVLIIALKLAIGGIFIFSADGLVRAAYKTVSRTFQA